MAWISPIAGLATQAIGLFGANNAAKKTNKQLDVLGKLDPKYTESSYAQDQLGLAQGMFNGRMAGAVDQERNIFANQANTLANIDMNASDGSQRLALAAGVQGQTNNAFNQLGIQEAADKQRRLANLTDAQKGMTEEHTKLFDDKVRGWQDEFGILMKKNQIKQQQFGNIASFGGSLAGFGNLTELFNKNKAGQFV